MLPLSVPAIGKLCRFGIIVLNRDLDMSFRNDHPAGPMRASVSTSSLMLWPISTGASKIFTALPKLRSFRGWSLDHTNYQEAMSRKMKANQGNQRGKSIPFFSDTV